MSATVTLEHGRSCMPERNTDPLWKMPRLWRGQHPDRLAYECLSAMAPFLQLFPRPDSGGVRTRELRILDGFRSDACEIDDWIKKQLSLDMVNPRNMAVRREAGEPARPRILVSAGLKLNLGIAIDVTCCRDPRTDELDLIEPVRQGYAPSGWRRDPCQRAMTLRGVSGPFVPFVPGDERSAEQCALATFGIFVVGAFDYAVSTLRQHAEVEIGLAVEFAPSSGPLPHLYFTKAEGRAARDKARADAVAAEEAERRREEEDRQLQADVAWAAGLPEDAARIEATISAAEASGSTRKVQIAILNRLGMTANYANLPVILDRLRRALDAGTPGWREAKTQSLNRISDGSSPRAKTR